MALPNPAMSFSPFAILTAEEMNNIVENIEALQDTSAFDNATFDGDLLIANSVDQEKLHATVGFHATTTQSIPDNSATTVTSYTETVDYGADFASGVFTAPYNGLYHFDLSFGITNLVSSTDGRVQSNIQIDTGSGYADVAFGFADGDGTNADPQANVSITIPLVAGNTVRATALHFSGGAESLTGPSFFSGFLIARS